MLIQGDLLSYHDYFQDWANTHAAVKFFCFGSVEKTIEFPRSFPDFDYPFVWLEQPVIQPLDNGATLLSELFHTGLSVLINAPGDNQRKQLEAYALSLSIINDLHAKLRKDKRAGLIMFETNTMKKESVNQLWVDNHYGYRLEVALQLNNNSDLFKR